MKILCVADLHFRQPWFDWVRPQAGNFGAVCLAGDLLDMFDADESGSRRQADWVLQWLARFPPGTPCHAVTGNHDVWQDDSDRYDLGQWLQRARRPGIVVDDDATKVDDYTLICWPWLGGVTPAPMRKQLILAHAPPAGCDVTCDDDRDLGDIDLRYQAEQMPPGSIVVSGHVHRPRQWASKIGTTLCVNAGCDDRRRSDPATVH